MAGRITHSEKQLRPDPRYGNRTLAKFTNCVMRDGRRTAAERCEGGYRLTGQKLWISSSAEAGVSTLRALGGC